MEYGRIVKVSGPLVVAEGMSGTRMYDVVRVGEGRLIGEIIGLEGDTASIQVYEETGGVGPGEPVEPTGAPLSVELGPGLIESIYDGIQRPLDGLREQSGDFIGRGLTLPGLTRERSWGFTATMKPGGDVEPGDVLGTVQETVSVEHRVMVPPGVSGKLVELADGEYTVEDQIGAVEHDGRQVPLRLMHSWPVRQARPFKARMAPDTPLVTGQRVIDMFFPVAKGGTACVPGPFGTGKTVVQHQLAKWVDADIVVYVGCGERGNEMTDVLTEFPELADPRSGEPLMKRSVLVANTSNMPVAAREASVYTGIAIAEYFRDMGYDVALMADSTSRWAEAMREISGRLEEMPAEEGYPAYLASRVASFYERAGRIVCQGRPEREGALSVVGAVSPMGGDLSDAVVQATLRVAKAFWSLEGRLAQQRHFPAIDWLGSYSLYREGLAAFYRKEVADDMSDLATQAMRLLEQESELVEIVRLVGAEALSSGEQLGLETARSLREDFLHQNAFHEVDTFASLRKQYEMLKTILYFHRQGLEAIEQGKAVADILALPVRDEIARARYIEEDKMDRILAIRDNIDTQMAALGAAVAR